MIGYRNDSIIVSTLHAHRLLRMRHSGFLAHSPGLALVSLSFIATIHNEVKLPTAAQTDVSSPCEGNL
jgi:hypothetical protein